MAEKTRKPTNLQITRSANDIYFSWTIGDKDYDDGQHFCWDLNGVRQGTTNKNKKGIEDLGKTTTSKKKTISHSAMTGSISFSVEGNRKKHKKKVKGKKVTINPGPSGYETKTVKFELPPQPDVAFGLVDQEHSNVGTFAWSIGNSTWQNNRDSSFQVYDGYEYQTMIIPQSGNSNPADSIWNANSKILSGTDVTGSFPYKESSSGFYGENYSWTRWFRMRAVGPKGSTPWTTKYHVYALPKPATVVNAVLSKKSAGNGYICSTQWTAANDSKHPVDTTTVQYAIGVPLTVGTLSPSGDKYTVNWYPPNDLSWSNGGTVEYTASGGMSFSIDQSLENDKLVYTRVNTKHDYNTVEGAEKIATGDVAKLVMPTDVQVDYSGYASTHRISVEASNETDLDASYIAVYFKTDAEPDTYICIGVIPHGTSGALTFAAPPADSEISVGTEIILGDYEVTTRDWGFEYTIPENTIRMRSSGIKWEEAVTLPPTVTCAVIDNHTINVHWTWNWRKANQSEISWADHEDAWYSTDPPQSYIVDNIYGGDWNIKGVDVGTWYVRVRHLDTHDDVTTKGLWSATQPVKVSSAPAIPSLVLSDTVVTPDAEVTCYWGYVSTDGTPQLQAKLCEAVFDEEENEYLFPYEPFATVRGVQSAKFSVAKMIETADWAPGDTRYIAVQVMSESHEICEGWSTPAALKIADPINCEIVSSSLVHINQTNYHLTDDTTVDKVYQLTIDDTVDLTKTYYTRSGEEGSYIYTVVENPVDSELSTYYECTYQKTYYTRSGEEGSYIYTVVENPVDSELSTYYEETHEVKIELQSLPLRLNVSGAGPTSKTIVTIERNGSQHLYRPDDSEIDGFDKELVCMKSKEGDGEVVINASDITGYLDDTAKYRVIAVTKIAYDEKEIFVQTDDDSIEFTVNWEHQAIRPLADVHIDPVYDVAIITPRLPDPLPEGATVEPGDVCDIYRLSIDKPQLIFSGAEFNETYVDPYPTIGDAGGYRLVYRTKDGDYTTSDGMIAWFDTPDDEDADDNLDIFATIIDFGTGTVRLPYNLSLNNKWSKSFQQTMYLGGHIQGDWNPTVSRTGSVNTTGIVTVDYGSDEDHQAIEAMRELAVYSGICHVRTPDGSNYTANVDVTEDREERWVSKLAKYTLDITAVDSQSDDAIPYDIWEESIDEEEE